MGSDAPTDVITDTSTLVNFRRIGRADLLAGLTSYRFVVTDHVRYEVTSYYPTQLSSFEFALLAGHVIELTLDTPADLTVFADLKTLRLGDGECASIAAALNRGVPLAIDDIRARKEAVARNPSLRLLDTVGLMVEAIQAGLLTDDDDPAFGGELPRDALPLQAAGIRMSGHGFFLLGLAQALEQANAAAVGVEGIDVVDDDELVAVPVELEIHAERSGIALDPARLAVQVGPDGAALGQAPGTDEDQQVEVPLGEGAEILLQPVVARQVEHFVRLSAAVCFGGRHGNSRAIRLPLSRNRAPNDHMQPQNGRSDRCARSDKVSDTNGTSLAASCLKIGS